MTKSDFLKRLTVLTARGATEGLKTEFISMALIELASVIRQDAAGALDKEKAMIELLRLTKTEIQ